MEAIRLKLTESLSTIRHLRIQMQKLEEEKKKLTETAHKYASTKLDDVERENASLKEKATANQQLIATMSVKINELSQQKGAIEEKLQSVIATKDMLEQKVIGQQATIQNVIQVHVPIKHLRVYTQGITHNNSAQYMQFTPVQKPLGSRFYSNSIIIDYKATTYMLNNLWYYVVVVGILQSVVKIHTSTVKAGYDTLMCTGSSGN